MSDSTQTLVMSIYACHIRIISKSERLTSVLNIIFNQFVTDEIDTDISLEFTVEEADDVLKISRDGFDDLITRDLGEFIFLFEKDLTIALQNIRNDLFFVHAAAIVYNDQAALLIAPSGTGKSTTTWAAINSGFDYLSDELAAIDLNTMTVWPYPHALCLKSRPPLFELPETTLCTSQTIHVYGDVISNVSLNVAMPLCAFFFLERDSSLSHSIVKQISHGEAAAKLYANTLNVLAHNNNDAGLEAAIELAGNNRNYALTVNALDDACNSIKRLMD
jgi:hypothetical protein